MIYLDNAATTYPKPQQVKSAVINAMEKYGANPGRGGHKMSLEASKEVFACRSDIAEMFSAQSEEEIIFTSNCTHSLNLVLKGILKPGDHVVYSSYEHNSVYRPATELSKIGVTSTVAKVYPYDNEQTLDSFRNAINEKTKLVVCIHASNVWGVVLPVERISALCHQYGIPVLVDAAQSAGVLPIDMKDAGFDFLCMSGHKGLYGPMGTGIMITDKYDSLQTIIEGGTGSDSLTGFQPSFMPDKFESGTLNVPGICGLKAGLGFVKRTGTKAIWQKEISLISRLYDRLANIEGVQLYTKSPNQWKTAPVLSFNVKGHDSELVAAHLDKNYNIAVRAGLHCSPLAHESIGTINTGTVRVSTSVFNNQRQIDMLAMAIQKISKK